MAANKECVYATDDQIKSMTVKELKDYLRRYGQFLTGHKSELINRAMGVRKLKLVDKMVVEVGDNAGKLETREEKLRTPLGEKIPEPNGLENWSRDVSLIPDLCDNDIYNYLVLEKGARRQHKSDRSAWYVADHHVHNVEYNQVSESCSHCVVRCLMIPSLPKKNEPDHVTWVCLSKVSGKVNSGDCGCTAGQDGACNHVAALLETLVEITNKKKDGTLASTSTKCKWNNPRKRKLSPKKAQDLNFSKTKRVRRALNKEESVYAGISGNDLGIKKTFCEESFKQRLNNIKSNAAWLTLFERQEVQELTVPQLITINFMFGDSVDLQNETVKEEIHKIYDSLYVSQEDCENIEQLTRGQNKNKQWYEARSQRITASNFGCIAKLKEATKPETLMKDVMGYRTFDNKYCAWGRSHEPAARRIYANSHKDIKVKQCGLVVNPKYPHLGASPDALLDGSKEGPGILEIKCPAAERWKNEHPTTCASDSDFFCKINENGEMILKRSHQYYIQVQGQLAISGRAWCDFMVWTLKGWTVERIHADSDCWGQVLPKLNKFYLEYVLPELFSDRIKRTKSLY